MPTPAFVPQPSTPPTTIRYHGPLDPYHYTVDNRPLSDIEANLITYGTGGIDSARRAGLITQYARNRTLQDELGITSAGYFEGLTPLFSGGQLGIAPGSLYIQDSVFTGSSIATIKQAILPAQVNTAISAPGTAGMSVDYLVQVQFVYLAGSASTIPYYDHTNTYLPSSTLVGQLNVNVKFGAAAATGTQVTPTADAGWLPLYAVTWTNGDAAPVVRLATGAPTTKKLKKNVEYFSSSDASPGSIAVGITGPVFPRFYDGQTRTMGTMLSCGEPTLSPYLPIRLRIVFRSNAAGNTVQFTLGYLSVRLNEAASGTTSINESVSAHSTANAVTAVTTTVAIIDPAQFAGFVSGIWSVNVEALLLSLSRAGASDSNTGDVDIIKVELVQ